MTSFWNRLGLIVCLWLVASLILLSLGVSVALAVGLSAVVYGISFMLGEWIGRL